jgi:hypothetical protein
MQGEDWDASFAPPLLLLNILTLVLRTRLQDYLLLDFHASVSISGWSSETMCFNLTMV